MLFKHGCRLIIMALYYLFCSLLKSLLSFCLSSFLGLGGGGGGGERGGEGGAAMFLPFARVCSCSRVACVVKETLVTFCKYRTDHYYSCLITCQHNCCQAKLRQDGGMGFGFFVLFLFFLLHS